MSVESEKATAELAAIGVMVEHFGLTEFAATKAFGLTYDELRDLLALAYLHGKRDATTEAQRIMAAS